MKRNSFTSISLPGLIEAACAIVVFCTVAGFCGRWLWVLEIFDHFRLHYAAGALLLGLLAWWMTRHRWALACFVVLVINLSLCPDVWSFHRLPPPPAPVSPETQLRALTINVLSSNDHYSDVLKLIQSEKPDMILMLEIDAKWSAELSTLKEAYHLVVSEPREDNFGIFFLVRNDLEAKAELFFPGTFGIPAVDALVTTRSGHQVRVIGLHTTPPRVPSYTREGRIILDDVAKKIAGMKQPVIVLGDLNAAPWSINFRKFLSHSGLKDSANGRGYLATWPTLANPIMRIPLDHCLVSHDIAVSGRWVGPEFGSDHLPLFVDVAIP